MNLSPYQNLCKAEKKKINSKDITERFLFSLYDTSIMSQIVERVQNYSILIAPDWCSPTMVSNVSCIRFLKISSINFIF